jgi:hypothetical protein
VHYRASWRYMSGWGIFIIIFGICFVSAGVLLREAILVIIGLGAFLYLWMIGQRLSVELLSDRFIYHGWFKKSEVRFDEILSVKQALDLDWPRNRIYGPLTYEIRTSGSCLLINLIYFGPEFSRKFQERFHGKLDTDTR